MLMKNKKSFGLSLPDQAKIDLVDAKVEAFINQCMLAGYTTKFLAPAFLAAGCSLLETATGSHEKAVMAFKGMLFTFEHAQKQKPQ